MLRLSFLVCASVCVRSTQERGSETPKPQNGFEIQLDFAVADVSDIENNFQPPDQAVTDLSMRKSLLSRQDI